MAGIENFHAEVWAMESAQLAPCAWEKWITQAEKQIGHDLDGTLSADGYSLDNAYEQFLEGRTIEAYIAITQERKKECA